MVGSVSPLTFRNSFAEADKAADKSLPKLSRKRRTVTGPTWDKPFRRRHCVRKS